MTTKTVITSSPSLTAVDPEFAEKIKEVVEDAFVDFLVADFDTAIHKLLAPYDVNLETLKAEINTVASSEWGNDIETADYFFLQEGFDTYTGKFF